MQVDVNMDRWIFASVGKHFDDLRGDYHLHIDGQERTYQGKDQWVELKVIGPQFKRYSAKYVRYDVGIMLFCNQVMNYEDQHAMRRLTGHFLSNLEKPIKIYRYGKDAVDDGSFVGCLVLRSDLDNPIDRIDYGQVEADVKVQLTGLEGQFYMEQSQ